MPLDTITPTETQCKKGQEVHHRDLCWRRRVKNAKSVPPRNRPKSQLVDEYQQSTQTSTVPKSASRRHEKVDELKVFDE